MSAGSWTGVNVPLRCGPVTAGAAVHTWGLGATGTLCFPLSFAVDRKVLKEIMFINFKKWKNAIVHGRKRYLHKDAHGNTICNGEILEII